jgi:hypothetical protein
MYPESVSAMTEMQDSLLAADDRAPVTVHNENGGSSPFLIVADHARETWAWRRRKGRAVARDFPPLP